MRVGAGNSAVVVDLPRWGPMLSPRVPNLVPIPGPRMERETDADQRDSPATRSPARWARTVLRSTPRCRAIAEIDHCGCPISCRGWSGGMFVFVDEAIAAGRWDDSKGQRVLSRVVVRGGVTGWSLAE